MLCRSTRHAVEHSVSLQDLSANIELLQSISQTDDFLEVPEHVVAGKSMPIT